MQEHELEAYLGPVAEDASIEQRADLLRAADLVEGRFPEEEWPDEARDAMAGATMLVLGDDDMDGLTGAWRAARREAEEAHSRMVGAMMAMVARGHSMVEVERATGLSRTAVRRAVGR